MSKINHFIEKWKNDPEFNFYSDQIELGEQLSGLIENNSRDFVKDVFGIDENILSMALSSDTNYTEENYENLRKLQKKVKGYMETIL